MSKKVIVNPCMGGMLAQSFLSIKFLFYFKNLESLGAKKMLKVIEKLICEFIHTWVEFLGDISGLLQKKGGIICRGVSKRVWKPSKKYEGIRRGLGVNSTQDTTVLNPVMHQILYRQTLVLRDNQSTPEKLDLTHPFRNCYKNYLSTIIKKLLGVVRK